MWSRWQSWSSRRALQRHYGQLCALSDADARGAARGAWIRLRGQLHRCVHLDDQDRLGHRAPLHLLDAWPRQRPRQSRQGRAPPRHHDPWSTWAIAQQWLPRRHRRHLEKSSCCACLPVNPRPGDLRVARYGGRTVALSVGVWRDRNIGGLVQRHQKRPACDLERASSFAAAKATQRVQEKACCFV